MKKSKLPKIPAKKSKRDEEIEERLIGCSLNEKNDIIYVGQLVERVLKGEFGAILKALTAGRTAEELQLQKSSSKTSDYHLGRLSAFNDLWNDLEQFVHDKDKMQETLAKDEMPVESFNYAP